MKPHLSPAPVLLATLGTMILAFSGPVAAKEGDLIARGSCGGRIKTKLKASPENGRIELEYELDNAAPNEAWRILIRKNGRTILRTTRRTNGFGDLEVRKLTSNGNGNERIEASAKRVSGGGVCRLILDVSF